MKVILHSVVALLASLLAFAQGTVQFQMIANGAGAIPPNGSDLNSVAGYATLNGTLFSGSIGIEQWTRVASVTIVRASNPSDLGSELYSFTPGLISAPFLPLIPGGREYDFTRSLTVGEISDLTTGHWYVNVTTAAFPNGEIRGPITIVPEPSSILLMAVGAVDCAAVGGWRRATAKP